MRRQAWTDTAFGHPDSWPNPLRSTVSFCLHAAFPVCIYWGPELCLLYNDAASLLPGEDHPSILGRPAGSMWNRMSPETADTLARVLREGTRACFEDQQIPVNRHGYREECYFTHTSTPIQDEDGRILGVLHSLQETTAKVLAERRSRAFTRLSRALAGASNSTHCMLDAVRELAANREDLPFVALYRRVSPDEDLFERKTVQGQRLSKAAADAIAPPALRARQDGVLELPPWAKPMHRPDSLPGAVRLVSIEMEPGDPFPASIEGAPVEQALLLPLFGIGTEAGPKGDTLGYLLCGLNPGLRLDAPYSTFFESSLLVIHSTLRALLHREQNAQHLATEQLALATGRFGTWMLDPASGEFELSQRAAELFRYRGSLRRCRMEWAVQQYHPEDRAGVKAAFLQALECGEDLFYEARLAQSDIEEHWLSVRGTLCNDAEGQPVLVGLVGDVSERHRAECLLRDTEKLAAAGRLAATVAHEINNPLESVTNLIYLATLDESLSTSTSQLLRSADSELSRVTHIAQQTLGFYRDTLGPVRVDLQKAVHDTAGLFERRPDLPPVQVDMSRVQAVSLVCLQGELRQVLSNLFVNAIQASAPGGRIRVAARQSRDWRSGEAVVRLSIADQGTGMDPCIRTKLFQPFFTTKRELGNGLGLWASRRSLDEQNGSIRFKSRVGPQSGTCFMITLPVQQRRSRVQ